MGRYYNGDIEGKFWFGVQSSDAADRFGVEGVQPEYLEYRFDTEHIPTIKEELTLIEKTINVKDYESYHYDCKCNKTAEELNITEDGDKEFADYRLGKQILERLEKDGECWFEAEL